MSFARENGLFEAWLNTQCDVDQADLAFKHERMCKSPMLFLRATFFHWARHIATICPDVANAPEVLAVGDIHLENFGTWRDAEGRLVWGVNDFDEAARMPYAFDLLRLATSIRLYDDRPVSAREACTLILEGYRGGLEMPRPALLDEDALWMRPLVVCGDRDRVRFWRKIEALERCVPPAAARDALQAGLPEDATVQFYARSERKGGGSLGRPRFLAIAGYQGGRIVREAKGFVTSAWDWVHGKRPEPANFMALARGPNRAPDPHLAVCEASPIPNAFIVRRLAANVRKLDLGADTRPVGDDRILMAMGADLAAIHAADSMTAMRIETDLAGRTDGWLHKNAKLAERWTRRTYEEYCKEAAG